jgi:hypothetical protein
VGTADCQRNHYCSGHVVVASKEDFNEVSDMYFLSYIIWRFYCVLSYHDLIFTVPAEGSEVHSGAE